MKLLTSCATSNWSWERNQSNDFILFIPYYHIYCKLHSLLLLSSHCRPPDRARALEQPMQPAQTPLEATTNNTWVKTVAKGQTYIDSSSCYLAVTQIHRHRHISVLYSKSDMCWPSTYAINDLALTGQTDCRWVLSKLHTETTTTRTANVYLSIKPRTLHPHTHWRTHSHTHTLPSLATCVAAVCLCT